MLLKPNKINIPEELPNLIQFDWKNPYLDYEAEKKAIQARNLPPAEYDRAIRELIERLNI